MRLTLRTLLAYMDGVLDPSDSADLEKRIAESDYARRLVQRIRDVVQRPRIMPPRVDAREGSTDANQMAEYLDGILEPQSVAAHERGCLASDALLAEAGACHQVLSRIVRDPATVSERTRRRLARRATEAIEEGGDGNWNRVDRPLNDAFTPADDLGDNDEEEEDYIDDLPAAPLPTTRATQTSNTGRGSKPAQSPSTSADQAALAAAAASLPQLRPAQRSPSPSNAASKKVAAAVAATTAAAVAADGSSISKSQAIVAAVEVAAATAPLLADSKSAPEDSKRRRSGLAWFAALLSLFLLVSVSFLAWRGDLQRWLGRNTNTAGSNASSSMIVAADDQRADRANKMLEPPGPPAHLLANPVESESSLDGTSASDIRSDLPLDSTASPENATTSEPLPLVDSTPPPTPAPIVTPDVPTATSAWKTPASAGMCLMQANGAERWSWMQGDQVMSVGSWLQSMPVDRLRLLADGDRELTLIGATRLQLIPTASSSAIASSDGVDLAVDFGRLILRRGASGNGRFVVRVGSRVLAIELQGAGSAIALERRRYRFPGEVAGPASTTASAVSHDLIQLIGITGSTAISDSTSTWILNAESAVVLLDDRTLGSGRIVAAPEWIDHQDELERASGESMARQLDRNLAPELAWTALLNHERPEVRMTALECLTEIGLYEALWNALDDAQNRTNWRRRLMAVVEEQLARGEGRAERLVAAASSAELGEQGLRLWQGMSPEQLAAGEGAMLVAGLEHEQLVIRALAFEQLLKITGTTELFVPEADPIRRELRVTEWRKRLAAGTIAYAQPIELPHVRFAEE